MAHELYDLSCSYIIKMYCITIIMSNRYYKFYHSKHIVFSKIDVQNFN